MVTASVVICTFNRPLQLPIAVQSVRMQVLRPGFSAELVVVDNSTDANARDTVLALASEDGLPLRYISEPRPNISLARNAGVAGSMGDFLVFIDDDERCEPGWLDAMIGTAEQSGGDVVFGPVLAEFPDGPPDWDPSGHSLERRIALPTGSEIGLRHDPKLSGRWIGTGNSAIRRATCFAGGKPPFEQALGGSGGEDYDLFLRLSQSGRRFIWCAEGVVWEPVPASRLTTEYRLRRAFATGQHFAAITVRRARHPQAMAAYVLIKAAVQLALLRMLALIDQLRGAAASDTFIFRLAMVRGKLLWWKLGL